MAKTSTTLECPKCQNDNEMMMDTYNHRREQMDINCQICGHSWTYKFPEVSRENIIPPGTSPLRRVG